MTLQRDDMLDLQAVVVDDDALDDQLQDRLSLCGAGGLQPRADALGETSQADQCLLSLKLLLSQAKVLLMLLLGQLPLRRQGFALA